MHSTILEECRLKARCSQDCLPHAAGAPEVGANRWGIHRWLALAAHEAEKSFKGPRTGLRTYARTLRRVGPLNIAKKAGPVPGAIPGRLHSSAARPRNVSL